MPFATSELIEWAGNIECGSYCRNYVMNMGDLLQQTRNSGVVGMDDCNISTKFWNRADVK